MEVKSYRAILRDHLEERCVKNPKYSLRAFARDLNLSSSRLSDVIRGRYGLSRESAEKIAIKLGLNRNEQSYFCDLVESEHARAKRNRMAAITRLESCIPDHQRLTLDAFQAVSDWYHFAILELIGVKNFQNSTKWMAARLGISAPVVEGAINRLKRLGLLKEVNKKLKAVDSFTTTTTDIPSKAIKKFHEQILLKAIEALHIQSVEERDFSNMMMAIHPKDIPDAKEMIKKFRRNLSARFEKSKTKSSVYCLSLQLFRVSEDHNQGEKE